jgi:hypothetical protein
MTKEQSADLRELHLHNLLDFQSYHLFNVDESGCDERIGFRRTGWSPLGVAPVQVLQLHCDKRYCLCMPKMELFSLESFVAPRIPLCSRTLSTSFFFIAEDDQSLDLYVLVMDNALFHRTERVRQHSNMYHAISIRIRTQNVRQFYSLSNLYERKIQNSLCFADI